MVGREGQSFVSGQEQRELEIQLVRELFSKYYFFQGAWAGGLNSKRLFSKAPLEKQMGNLWKAS